MKARSWWCAVLLAVAGPAWADYNAECRTLAGRLAGEPGSLIMGELDVLKSCLSSLQRGIMNGAPPPAGSPPACPPPPPPAPRECPACPSPVACPKDDRPAADPVRQRFIPRY